MKPILKILVPIDFSSYSTDALYYAVDIARRYDASLELLHVFQSMTHVLPENYIVPGPDYTAKIMEDLQQRLVEAKQAAIKAGAERVETRLLQGGATTEILRVARSDAFDLIVMATHGRTGFRHLLIGSVTENIVRTAPCPVLTVRAYAQAEAARP